MGNAADSKRMTKMRGIVKFANRAFEVGKYEDAIILYSRILTTRAFTKEAQKNMGIALFRTGKMDDAIQTLRTAWERDRDNMEIPLELAKAYWHKDDSASAEKYLNYIIDNGGDCLSEALFTLGKICFIRGDLGIAQDCFENAAMLDYKNYEIHMELASLLNYQKQYSFALEELTIALELNPADPQIPRRIKEINKKLGIVGIIDEDTEDCIFEHPLVKVKVSNAYKM